MSPVRCAQRHRCGSSLNIPGAPGLFTGYFSLHVHPERGSPSVECSTGMAPPSSSAALALDLVREHVLAAPSDDVEATVLHLFDTHATRLRRYVCRCGLAPDVADDVVQDAFVALFRHLRNGGNRDNLAGWLVQVSFRLALKARHRAARRSSQEQPLHDSAFDVADAQLTGEARLLTRQRREWVRSVVRALPERERRCLSMRAEGVTYRTIALELGMSLGAVAKAVARAAARLSHVTKER